MSGLLRSGRMRTASTLKGMTPEEQEAYLARQANKVLGVLGG